MNGEPGGAAIVLPASITTQQSHAREPSQISSKNMETIVRLAGNISPPTSTNLPRRHHGEMATDFPAERAPCRPIRRSRTSFSQQKPTGGSLLRQLLPSRAADHAPQVIESRRGTVGPDSVLLAASSAENVRSMF